MTADEIKTAFRFIAMGRPNHPEVVALAEYLAAPSEPFPAIVPEMLNGQDGGEVVDTTKPKRGRKKAE